MSGSAVLRPGGSRAAVSAPGGEVSSEAFLLHPDEGMSAQQNVDMLELLPHSLTVGGAMLLQFSSTVSVLRPVWVGYDGKRSAVPARHPAGAERCESCLMMK